MLLQNEIDKNRLPFNTFDHNRISEVLPMHMVENYPIFVKFLEIYYEYVTSHNDTYDSPTKFLDDVLNLRDITSVDTDLIKNLKIELLLGREYFNGFTDERTALKYSNNLYRSKGSIFSIQQFFKMFYNKLVEVSYPKDNMFIIGNTHKIQDEQSQLVLYNNHKLTIQSAYQNLLDYRDNGFELTQWGQFLLSTLEDQTLTNLEEEIFIFEEFLKDEYKFMQNIHKKRIYDAYQNLLDYRDYNTPMSIWGNFLYHKIENAPIAGVYSYSRGDIIPSANFIQIELEDDVKAYNDFLNDKQYNITLFERIMDNIFYLSPEAASELNLIFHPGVSIPPFDYRTTKSNSVYRDNILNKLFYLETTEENSGILPFDYRPKESISVNGSSIGYESEKYITDGALYQTLSILIDTDLPLSRWKDVYKLFVHPAGMYLGANLSIVENAFFETVETQPEFEFDPELFIIQEEGSHTISSEMDITFLINNDNNVEFRTNTEVLGNMQNIVLTQLDNTYNNLAELVQASSPTMDNDLESGIDDKAITMDIDWISLDTFDEVYYPPDSDGQ